MIPGTAQIVLNSVPDSLNKATRGRGIATHRKKKLLEEEMVMRLLAAGVPKSLTRVEVSASLRFPTRHRRDPDNFGFLLAKAMGDALAPHSALHPHRWLQDDTAEYYAFFQPVTFEKEIGSPRTILSLAWMR